MRLVLIHDREEAILALFADGSLLEETFLFVTSVAGLKVLFIALRNLHALGNPGLLVLEEFLLTQPCVEVVKLKRFILEQQGVVVVIFHTSEHGGRDSAEIGGLHL